MIDQTDIERLKVLALVLGFIVALGVLVVGWMALGRWVLGGDNG